MEYRLSELLDIPKLQALLDGLDELYSIPSAIIDMEGDILTGTSWQDICVKFHREHPESEQECIKSDTHIASELSKGKTQVVYKCPKGLVDAATPIIVEGEHVGNAFTGQFFLEPPDEEHFREIAKRYGFDEGAYIEAMRRVPVITEDKHKKNLKVLSTLTRMLAEMGLQQKRQKEYEKKLENSRVRLNTILDNVGACIFIKDINYRYKYANRKTLELFRCTEEELIGRGDDSFFPRKSVDEIMKSDRPVIECGETIVREEVGLTAPDNVPRTYLTTKLPLKDSGGNIYELCGISTDITEMKLAKEKLERSLKEKETLLKEVHHRVKNNMAIISTLIRMQSACAKDPEVLEMFRESRGRIKAMALVHEKLYKTESFASIDVPEYIASLAETIKTTFSDSGDVELTFDIDEVALNIDILIPCGLIINELLTNAFKHAFDGRENPTIGIKLKLSNGRDIELSIMDNGKGLPEGFDIKRPSGLGLQLVTTLTRQIQGGIACESSDGTTFTLTFPRNIPFSRA